MQILRNHRTLSKLFSAAVLFCTVPLAFSLNERDFRKELEKDTEKLIALREEIKSFKGADVDKEYKNTIRKELYEENRRHTALVRKVKPLLDKYKKTRNINITNNEGQTLLMLTAAVGNDVATEMLLLEKPNMSMVDNNSQTALQYEKNGSGTALLNHIRSNWASTISTGDINAVRELLDCDANPNWEIDGSTALELAIQENNIALVTLLMDYHASPAEKTGLGCTITEMAVKLNAAEGLKELLRNKDAVLCKFLDDTPIFLNLMSSDKAECLRAWFAGARAHNITQTESGTSYFNLIIRTAAEEGALMVAEDNQDLLNTEDAEGNLPLFEAARRGSAPLYHALIQLGAKPEMSNKLGETVLMHACMSNNNELLKELIEASASEILNRKDSTGQSAYHYAERAQNSTAIRLLTEAGARKP